MFPFCFKVEFKYISLIITENTQLVFSKHDNSSRHSVSGVILAVLVPYFTVMRVDGDIKILYKSKTQILNILKSFRKYTYTNGLFVSQTVCDV